MSDMDKCKHRWADSPSDAGEGIFCTRCGDMANVSQLRKRIEELEAECEQLGADLNGTLDRAVVAEATLERVRGLPEKWRKRLARPWQPCAKPERFIDELEAELND